jgi:predicted protein tyrosine phosphatase
LRIKPVRAARHSPELLILSRKKAEAYDPSGREACISVTDVDDETLPRLSSAFAAILRVAFSDIDEPSADPADVLFNHAHATQIADFVRRWAHVDRIVVHCMAGQSRSPGIALGLCELFSWDPGDLEERYPFWNPWVRRELVRAGHLSRHGSSRRLP